MKKILTFFIFFFLCLNLILIFSYIKPVSSVIIGDDTTCPSSVMGTGGYVGLNVTWDFDTYLTGHITHARMMLSPIPTGNTNENCHHLWINNVSCGIPNYIGTTCGGNLLFTWDFDITLTSEKPFFRYNSTNYNNTASIPISYLDLDNDGDTKIVLHHPVYGGSEQVFTDRDLSYSFDFYGINEETNQDYSLENDTVSFVFRDSISGKTMTWFNPYIYNITDPVVKSAKNSFIAHIYVTSFGDYTSDTVEMDYSISSGETITGDILFCTGNTNKYTIVLEGDDTTHIKGFSEGEKVTSVSFPRFTVNVSMLSGGTYYFYLPRDILLTGDVLEGYKENYGDFFIEFYQGDISENLPQNCYYEKYEQPVFIYSLNASLYGDTAGYIWHLCHVGTSGDEIYDGGKIIFLTGVNQSGKLYPNFNFVTTGSWIIKLYNMDNNSLRKDLVWQSNTVQVCEVQDKEITAKPSDFYGFVLSTEIKIIIAVVIIMVLTLSPLIIATALSVKGHFTQVSIPALVYIGFFFLGTCLTCILGFLDWSVLFIELLALIIAFAVLYISRKGESGE